MIKPKDMVNIYTWMVQYIKESGLMINNKVRDMKPGQIVRFMKGNIMRDKGMERVNSTGLTTLNMKDNSVTTKFMVKESIPTQTAGFITVIG